MTTSLKKLSIVAALASVVSLAGCAMGSSKKASAMAPEGVRLSASSQIPAADGQVTLKNEKNNNTALNVEVKHLAEPQKIDPSANTFVVWSRPTRNSLAQPQSLGALVVDQNLNGRLNTVTPQKNFEIFITAEPSAQVSEPTGDRLMWTTVDLQ